MRDAAWFPALKVLSWIVLLLMLVAAGYTIVMALNYWPGIRV